MFAKLTKKELNNMCDSLLKMRYDITIIIINNLSLAVSCYRFKMNQLG